MTKNNLNLDPAGTPGPGYATDTIADIEALNDVAPHYAVLYGATGDGVTDDSAAIQAAIDAAAAESAGVRGVVVLGQGRFKVVGGLDLGDKPITIRGAGPRATSIEGDGSADVISAAHASETTGIVLEDFAVSNDDAATFDGVSLGENVTMWAINRVHFANARYGLRVHTNSDVGHVTDCVFGSSCQTYGLRIDTGAGYIAVKGCWFNENANGLYSNGHDCTFLGSMFEDTGTAITLDTSAVRNTLIGNGLGSSHDPGFLADSAGIRVYGDNNLLIGNWVADHTALDIQFEAGSSGNVALANHLGGGTVTDSGTGNTVVHLAGGQLLMPGGTEAAPGLSRADDPDTGIRIHGSNLLSVILGGAEAVQFNAPTSNDDTVLYVMRRQGGVNTVQRVTQGAADSGGTGYKALRVPN